MQESKQEVTKVVSLEKIVGNPLKIIFLSTYLIIFIENES